MHINKTFSLPLADVNIIEDIINKLDSSKATGVDNIPARVVKLSAKVIKKPLTTILNSCINNGNFPDLLKLEKITPLYKNLKENSRLDKKCYRPVSVLTIL